MFKPLSFLKKLFSVEITKRTAWILVFVLSFFFWLIICAVVNYV